jgi:hypothetical protein
MSAHTPRFRHRVCLYLVLLLSAAAAVALKPAQVFAAPKYGNSLDWAPADAVFYSSSLRLREQIEIAANSKAWAKLTSLPAVQMAWQFAMFGLHRPGGPGDQAHQFLAQPENKELLDLVKDAFSNEFLCYGDSHAADFVEIALRTINAMQYSSMVADLHSGPADQKTVARILLNSLDLHRDRLAAPGIVLGFKLSNTERAQSQLKRLEAIAKQSLDSDPRFQGSLKRTTIGGNEYLTLELDGKMVPWHEVPWDQLAEKPNQYDELRTKLMNLKLVVTAGIRGDYLLFTIGSSTDHLAALGSGELLADLPELKPLAKYADQRLVDVSFVSKSMLQAVSNTSRDLDELVNVVRRVLPQAGLSEEMNQRITKDAQELAGDVKTMVPVLGSHTAFSFLTPRGFEGYAYDWSQDLYSDFSKPLGLLDNMGGDPILAVVGRTKYSPQQYDTLRKWLTKAYGYFEELAVPNFNAEQRQQYAQIKEIALPLVARLDKATGQMLIPALADGQTGFALDAKATSKRWFEGMPESDQPLPMLEAAIVLGVSDAALLKSAVNEYRAVAHAVLEKVKEMHPQDVPADFKLPEAETREVKAGDATGTIYWYKLPEGVGVDSQLTPNAGLTAHVAVLSLEPKHTVRLLTPTPLVVAPDGPLSNRSKPLSSAVSFHWDRLVESLTPWIDFGMQHVAPDAAAALGGALFLSDNESKTQWATALADDAAAANTVQGQVHTLLDVLKTFRSVESATYQEDGATVTHSLTLFQDVP